MSEAPLPSSTHVAASPTYSGHRELMVSRRHEYQKVLSYSITICSATAIDSLHSVPRAHATTLILHVAAVGVSSARMAIKGQREEERRHRLGAGRDVVRGSLWSGCQIPDQRAHEGRKASRGRRENYPMKRTPMRPVRGAASPISACC